MKTYIPLLFSILIIYGCKKNGSDPGGGNTPQPVDPHLAPASAPISANFGVYAVNNNNFTNPLNVSTGNTYYTYAATTCYSSPVITNDQYTSRINATPNLTVSNSIFGNKTFTAISTNKNYVNIVAANMVSAGSVLYDYGTGTFPLPGGGEIYLPPYSFGNHGGSVTFGISASYLLPSTTDYALALPCYPIADEDQKRWFLNSYGVYLIRPAASDNSGTNIDFSAASNVKMKLKIPAPLVATAPDSIATWNLGSNGVWKKNGYANKVNGNYEKRLDHKGYWNFAVAVKGVYLTLRLRTTNGSFIPNTRFKILDGVNEVADARTDADGNSLVFVPSDRSLNIQVIADHYNWTNSPLPPQNLGSFNKVEEKTVVQPDRYDLVAVQGRVFNCDGTPMGNSTVVISNTGAKDNYVVPVTNSVFKTALWTNYGYNKPTVTVRDASGTTLYTSSFVTGTGQNSAGLVQNLKLNFYGCAATPKLYSIYNHDGTEITVDGELNSTTPVLTANDGEITINNNGIGLYLKGWFTTVGGNYFLNGLKVDGVACNFDNSRFSEIVITRKDAFSGGIIEGWFQIFYKDAANTSHSAIGNFRVKRL